MQDMSKRHTLFEGRRLTPADTDVALEVLAQVRIKNNIIA